MIKLSGPPRIYPRLSIRINKSIIKIPLKKKNPLILYRIATIFDTNTLKVYLLFLSLYKIRITFVTLFQRNKKFLCIKLRVF